MDISLLTKTKTTINQDRLTEMAYNRKNYLKKVLKVQEITLEHRAQGLYFKEIFYLYIENQFNICQRTYENYLGVNVRKQLKDLQEKEHANQTKLF